MPQLNGFETGSQLEHRVFCLLFQKNTHLQHNIESHNQVSAYISGAVSDSAQQAVVSRVQNRYCRLLPQIAQNSVSTPKA